MLTLSVLAWLPNKPALAQDVSLLISRNTEITTVYLSAPARFIDEIGPSQIADWLPFDIRPTFAHGQLAATSHMALAQNAFSLLASDGDPIVLTSGPTLLHVAHDPLSFDTPMAASLSTSVCATPRDVLPSLDDLQIYTSLTADVSGDTPLSHITMPSVLASSGPVDIRVFEHGVLVLEQSMSPNANGVLSIAMAQRTMDDRRTGALLFGSGVLIALLSGWAAFAPHRKGRVHSSHAA